MAVKITPHSLIKWEYAKGILASAYKCDYVADTWRQRLGFDDLAILQTSGNATNFKAWKTCLLYAVNNGDLATLEEQWAIVRELSSPFAQALPRPKLIPPSHAKQGDRLLMGEFKPVIKYTVSPVAFADYLTTHKERPSEYIAAWFEAFGVRFEQEPKAEAVVSAVQRKKLIPKQRDANSGLLLIYELVEHYQIGYLDELPPPAAWAKIVSGEFTSDLVQRVSDAKKSIILDDGNRMEKTDFMDKYRKRFK